MFYILIVFLVFQTVITELQAVTILVAMEGKKMWQLNLQWKSLILQLVFGTHVPQCTKFFYQLVFYIFQKLNCFLCPQCGNQAVI